MQKETVVVRRKGQVDKLRGGNPVTTTFDVTGCVVWPAASHEENQGWVQIDGYNFKAPAGSDIKAEDEVQVRGNWYQVEGVPGDYGRKGLIVNARRVS